MTRVALAILSLLIVIPYGIGLYVAPVEAQGQSQVLFFSITVDDTAAGVGIPTATLRPNPAGQPQVSGCSMRLETADVRYRYDGTAPTATVGVLLSSGSILENDFLPDLMAIRFIRTTATSGVIQGHCWTNR